MSNFDKELNKAVDHGEYMHQKGLEYGRVNTISEIVRLLLGVNELSAARAVLEMNDTMTPEQYEADAKADNRTEGQFNE